MTRPPAPYTLRPATAADRPAILELLSELAPQLDPVGRWRWIYEGNPAGPALTWLAIDDASGTVAGLTSYFPTRLWLQGEVVRAALGGDGYVRPAFRRRGIAGALHAALRAEMPAHAIEVMFGAPAEANISPLRSSGSCAISELVRYVRPLSAGALLPRAVLARRALDRLPRPLRLPPLPRLLDPLVRPLLGMRGAGARLDPMREEDPRVDEVWAMTRRELQIATVRDSTYYQWRFLRAPSNVQHAYVVLEGQRPIALCALQERAGRLHIVDLCAPASAWGAALAAIGRTAGDLAALEISLLREQGRARALWRRGFIAREGHTYLVVTPEGSRRRDALNDAHKWVYMGGDSDVDRLS
jgi:hypothetical protein